MTLKEEFPASIRRAARSDHPYMMLTRDTAQDVQISYEALGVLVYLLSKPDDWLVRVSDLRKRKYGKKDCYGRDKMYDLIAELQDARYIVKTPRRGKGGTLAGWEWIVYEIPQPNDGKTVTRLDRNTEKPSHGNSGSYILESPTDSETLTESETVVANATEPLSKPKKERPQNPLFNAIRLHFFNNSSEAGWNVGQIVNGDKKGRCRGLLAYESERAGQGNPPTIDDLAALIPGYAHWCFKEKGLSELRDCARWMIRWAEWRDRLITPAAEDRTIDDVEAAQQAANIQHKGIL